MIYQDIGCACNAVADGDIGFARKLRKKLKRAVNPKRIVKRSIMMPKRFLKLTMKPHKALLRAAGYKKAARRMDGVIDQTTDTVVDVVTPIADTVTQGGASAVLTWARGGSTDNQAEPAPVAEPSNGIGLPIVLAGAGLIGLAFFLRR